MSWPSYTNGNKLPSQLIFGGPSPQTHCQGNLQRTLRHGDTRGIKNLIELT